MSLTMALCLVCGHIKDEALKPCPSCGRSASEFDDFDVQFTEKTMSPNTLEQFGAVIQRICAADPDPQVRYWTFLQYLSNTQPTLARLEIDTDDPMAEPVARLIAELQLLPITIHPATRP